MVFSDSNPILNATLNATINLLYQCQSRIVFIIIQGRTTCHGRGVVSRHAMVGASFTTCPGHGHGVPYEAYYNV